MFLLLWYSPPEIVVHSEGYVPANPSRPRVVYVFDNRKVLREDEEILLLKP